MQKFTSKFIILFISTLIIFLNNSCSRDKYDNEELYNSVGFDPGTSPSNGINGGNVPPDYFYRQAQMGMNQPSYPQTPPNYPQPQPMPYSAPYQAQYYPPSYASPPYQVYPNAGSRFYSNPYAIPPSPYYQQYDADQYYVPPTYSYGMEQSGNNRKSNIMR
jgi:hypothetical protein